MTSERTNAINGTNEISAMSTAVFDSAANNTPRHHSETVRYVTTGIAARIAPTPNRHVKYTANTEQDSEEEVDELVKDCRKDEGNDAGKV